MYTFWGLLENRLELFGYIASNPLYKIIDFNLELRKKLTTLPRLTNVLLM